MKLMPEKSDIMARRDLYDIFNYAKIFNPSNELCHSGEIESFEIFDEGMVSVYFKNREVALCHMSNVIFSHRPRVPNKYMNKGEN